MLDVLFIGDATQLEFREARVILSETTRVVDMPSVEAALEFVRTADRAPALVVVAVAHPGQFRTAEIESLYRAAPLLKIVALLGTWCEGETRTGQPWPADDRLFWYQWTTWWQRQMHVLAQGKRPSWDMPRTATEQDRALVAESAPQVERTGLIAVAARDHATYTAIADALSAFGCSAVWFRPLRSRPLRSRPLRWPAYLSNTTGGVWDGGPFDEREVATFAAFSARLAPVPVVVLLDFPRIEAVTRAKRLGATAVLGKPYSIDALVSHFETDIPR